MNYWYERMNRGVDWAKKEGREGGRRDGGLNGDHGHQQEAHREDGRGGQRAGDVALRAGGLDPGFSAVLLTLIRTHLAPSRQSNLTPLQPPLLNACESIHFIYRASLCSWSTKSVTICFLSFALEPHGGSDGGLHPPIYNHIPATALVSNLKQTHSCGSDTVRHTVRHRNEQVFWHQSYFYIFRPRKLHFPFFSISCYHLNVMRFRVNVCWFRHAGRLLEKKILPHFHTFLKYLSQLNSRTVLRYLSNIPVPVNNRFVFFQWLSGVWHVQCISHTFFMIIFPSRFSPLQNL